MKEDDLIMERLRELDFNGDKSIEFPEFVWGLSAWVGMDEDLEEEEASNLPLIPQDDLPQEDAFNLDDEAKQEEKQPAPEHAEHDEQRVILQEQSEKQDIVVAVEGDDE